jgi:hypothetical protein
MTTNRTPIKRPGLPQVSARAIQLFVELERCRRARKRSVDCTIDGISGYCSTRCRTCRSWFDAHAELHSELQLKPWIWPCVPHNPFPPNSSRAKEWRGSEEQEALQAALDQARRAARAA